MASIESYEVLHTLLGGMGWDYGRIRWSFACAVH
jgi:hypothetical protein